MEGIEGASASVLDIIDNEVFNRQKTALCFAYKELDGDAAEVENSNKEDSEQLDNELTLQEEEQVVESSEEVIAHNDCGEEMAQEDQQCEDCHMDEDGDDDDKDSDDDKDDDDDDKQDDEPSENPEPAYSEDAPCDDGEPAYSGEPEGEGEPAPSCEDELLMKCGELEAKNGELMARVEQLEKELEEVNCKYSDYEQIKEQLAKANQALFAIDCEKRVAEAHELLDDENVSKEQCDAIFEKCARGEYASSDALRTDVALAVFNANKGSKVHKKETFSAPIAKPVELKSNKNMSAMDKLKAYVGRE